MYEMTAITQISKCKTYDFNTIRYRLQYPGHYEQMQKWKLTTITGAQHNFSDLLFNVNHMSFLRYVSGQTDRLTDV